MQFAELAAIAARSIGAWIGEPSRVTLHPLCPVSIFVCPVGLPRGCHPPDAMRCRIGAGSALDAATARNLCLLEGIERYSLQFREGDPTKLASTAIPGALEVSRPIDSLRLGYPPLDADAPIADSRGCSVGIDLADAALRGLLELAEHDALEIWRTGRDRFQEVAPGGFADSLGDLLVWLGANGFRLRVFEHRHRSGATAYVGVCSDAAGERPATGSAAGLDARRAAVHACVESVVAWLNFAEIAKKPSRVAALSPEDRLAVDIYRGVARGPEPLPEEATLLPASIGSVAQDEPRKAFARMVELWDVDVAVFDLSRLETGIVTVRVVRLAM